MNVKLMPHHLALLVALGLLVGPGVPFGEESAMAERPQPWNDTRLLDWVSAMGTQESRYDELASVQSFELLQRTLEEAKQMVLHEAQSEQEAIEGLRMLLKHLAMSTRDSLEGDYRNPLFAKTDTRHRDIGAYNPDAEYDQVPIDGRYDYRLSGHLGDVPYISITINGSAEAQYSRLVAYLDDAAIRKHADAAGNYTLWLSKRKPAKPGAWIELPDTANGIVIRQYVPDRERNTLARFAIEAVGDSLPDVERMADQELAARISLTANSLVVGATWHRTLLPEVLEQPNVFVASTGRAIGASAANAENYYQLAHYQLADDEVLVVTFDPPQTKFWNLTSATIWHESRRYLTDPVSLTLDEVTPSADGKIRFVVARHDPGQPNWIKTFGHERGFLLLRIVGVEKYPLPGVQRSSVKELAALLNVAPGTKIQRPEAERPAR